MHGDWLAGQPTHSLTPPQLHAHPPILARRRPAAGHGARPCTIRCSGDTGVSSLRPRNISTHGFAVLRSINHGAMTTSFRYSRLQRGIKPLQYQILHLNLHDSGIALQCRYLINGGHRVLRKHNLCTCIQVYPDVAEKCLRLTRHYR